VAPAGDLVRNDEDAPNPKLADLERLHSAEAIQARLEEGPRESYLRDWVYGAVDGTVTTFAIVAGVSGAELSPTIVIVLGFANLFGDGFSMAAGNYLGTRSEQAHRRRQVAIEREHIRLYPQGEREEVRQIFARKGFEGAELESIVDHITADRERWIETMLQEEHGLARIERHPLRAAAATFLAFLLVGLVPLLAYVWDALAPESASLARPFLWSSILTALAFFGVGALKSRFVGERWWVSGFETTAVGGFAASIAYAVGALLRGVLVP
jgi:VIT1/CCC1 family predicted Fe2+/Mn2+ transporter